MCDLVEQLLYLQSVAGVPVGHDVSDDLAANGVKREIQFPPAPMGVGAMLLFQPLASTVDFQSRAVDEDVNGATFGRPVTLPLVRRSPCTCSSARRR